MVAFELSAAHFPDIAMPNSIVDEVFWLYFLWRVVDAACVLRSVPWSQRLSIPYPWRWDFSNTPILLNTGHSVTAIPACLFAEWQCG